MDKGRSDNADKEELPQLRGNSSRVIHPSEPAPGSPAKAPGVSGHEGSGGQRIGIAHRLRTRFS
jgi:hypothetical protein